MNDLLLFLFLFFARKGAAGRGAQIPPRIIDDPRDVTVLRNEPVRLKKKCGERGASYYYRNPISSCTTFSLSPSLTVKGKKKYEAGAG